MRKMGPSTILTDQEELKIKKWIIDKAYIGYPMHTDTVKMAVKNVLDQVKRPNPSKNNLSGRKWLELFLNRHPVIGYKNTEVSSKSRAAVTEDGIRQWFRDVEKYLQEENALDILEDPSRIYNMDETGVQLRPKTGKVLGPKKEKNLYAIAPGQDKMNMTVLCTYSADGKGVRPMIVYPYKRMPSGIIASVPNGYMIGNSDSGFYEYIANGFHPQSVNDGITFPVILFFDGHKSHISIELHDFCVEKRILLYCLLPNATHILQPCDVGIFRPLKESWKRVVAAHAQSTRQQITKHNFAQIFNSAYVDASNPDVIKKSFECCGLFPFNPEKIDYSKCMSNRHSLIRSSTLEITNKPLNIFKEAMLSELQSKIPENILQEFEEALSSRRSPKTEITLFSIRQIIKKDLLDQNSSTKSTIFGSSTPSVERDSMSFSDQVSQTSSSTNISTNDGLALASLDTNIIQDSYSQYSSNIQIILENVQYQQDVQESLGEDQGFGIPAEKPLSNRIIPVLPEIIMPNSIGDCNTSIILDTNMSIIDITESQYDSNGNFILHDEPIDGSTDNRTKLHLDVTTVLKTNQPATDNRAKMDVDVRDVWDQHLHFPRIETANKKIQKEPQILALTSENWKDKHLEKVKKQEPEKLEKEIKKNERAALKKKKLEEKKAKKRS